ncbi:MAG: hypothetical protein N4A59_08020 [Marinifilum sp.]|jgi:hypothetical protein|nr:hypothetical protein [Marinifilum sp.]
MTITLQINNRSKLLTTLGNADIVKMWQNSCESEKQQATIHRRVAALIDMPYKKRIRTEGWIIRQGHCPGCGASLNDIANHLEGKTLNYKCTYCKTK